LAELRDRKERALGRHAAHHFAMMPTLA
jgi:hypothetical protein